MFSSSDHAFSSLSLFLLLVFLPTQLGRHFWLPFSYVNGIRIDYLSPTLYFTDILLFLIFAVYFIPLLHSIQIKKLQLRPFPFLFIPTSYISAIFLCVISICGNIYFSHSPLLALYAWIKVTELTFFAWFLYWQLKNKQTKKYSSYFFIIGVSIQAILALLQQHHGGSLNGIWYLVGERTFSGETPGIANASIFGQLMLRPYGTLPHPNVLAAFLLIGIYFLIFTNHSRKRMYKAVKGFLFLLFAAALILTLSRTAIILLGVFVVGYVFSLFSRRKAILLISGITIMLALLFPPVLFRFASITLADETIIKREFFMQVSLEIIRTHPLFGTGLSNYLPVMATQFPSITYDYLQPVHSFFLMSFSELGIPITLLILFVGVRFTYSLYSSKRYFSIGLLSILLFLGMTDHFFWTVQQGQLLFIFCLVHLSVEGVEIGSAHGHKILKAKERKI